MSRSILKTLISISLLGIALFMLDLNSLGKTILRGSPLLFIIVISINLVMFMVMSIRWRIMEKPVLSVSSMMSTAIYFKATFFNTFTPANFGGDAYRLVALKSEAVSAGEVLKLLLRERILGLYGYVILFVLAYVLIAAFADGGLPSTGNPYVYGLAVAAMIFLMPLIVRIFGVRMASVLRRFVGEGCFPGLEGWVNALANQLNYYKSALWPMMLTFLGILLWVISIKVVAEGFGLDVPIVQLVAVATLVELVRLVPITIQGIGLREGTFAYLLTFFGHNPEQCYSVGLIAYLALSLSIILCGPIGQMLMWQSTLRGEK